jgi:hypothetical protein
VTLDELFGVLTKMIREGAAARGFDEMEPQSGAFGGRSAHWRRRAEELVFSWDAKEQWFSFIFRPAPDHPPAFEWTGTLSDRYTGHDISDSDAQQLREGLTGVLAALWTRRPSR